MFLMLSIAAKIFKPSQSPGLVSVKDNIPAPLAGFFPITSFTALERDSG